MNRIKTNANVWQMRKSGLREAAAAGSFFMQEGVPVPYEERG